MRPSRSERRKRPRYSKRPLPAKFFVVSVEKIPIRPEASAFPELDFVP